VFVCVCLTLNMVGRRVSFSRVLSLIFSVIDTAVVFTILLWHTDWQLSGLVVEVHRFTFGSSFVDLLLLPLGRNALYFGGFIATVINVEEAHARCKKAKNAILFFLCTLCYYTLIKLLIVSDGDEFAVWSTEPWFWCLFAWNMFASLTLYAQWATLCGKLTARRQNCVILNIESADERTSLLSGRQRGSCIGINTSTSPNEILSSQSFNGETTSNSFTEKNKSETNKSERGSGNKTNFMKIFSYTMPDWILLIFGVIFLSVSAVAESMLPLYIGKVVSSIVVKDDNSKVLYNISIMAIISVVASVFAGCRGGTFSIINQRTDLRIRKALFNSITVQEIGFFDEANTGDIMSRLVSDTTTLSNCLGLNMNIFLRTSIKIVGACVFMFSLSWRMSLITFLGIPIVSAVSKIYGYYYEKLQKEIQDRYAKANSVADEVFSSMQTVRSFANEKAEQKRFEKKLEDVYVVQKKQAMFYSGFIWCNEILQLLPQVLIMFYGGLLIHNNKLLAEKFVSFIIYQEEISNSFIDMASVYTGIMQALGAADKVFDLIERSPKIDINKGEASTKDVEGHVQFNNVSFTYPTRPEEPILHNLSFEAKPGEVVALVGPSGGGKSSCVKLFKRFYEASSGSILLDGKNVNEYQHESFHQTVTMVSQEPVLYARSIGENIMYGLDDQLISQKQIRTAAIQANAHGFITSLDSKYEAEAGEKGGQLSGGQKQRIAIARALVRKPRVMFLDEATSALDTESEFLVQEALEKNRSGRTVVLIAHRLSTVKNADKIVVILKGRAVEIGTHDSLMQQKGVYYKLVYRQLKSNDKLTKSNETDDDTFIPSNKQTFVNCSHQEDNTAVACLRVGRGGNSSGEEQ